MRNLIVNALLSFGLTAMAQDVKQTINSIKQNANYMNAEDTEEDRGEAFEQALADLTSQACSRFNAEIQPDGLKPMVKTLDVQRGNSTRVFVYALVSDMERLAHGSASPAPSQPAAPQKPTVPQKPAQTPSPSLSSPTVGQTEDVTAVFARMNTLTEIKSLLRQYKPEGKIADYNWVSSLSVDPDACIIIFDGEKITAILMQEKNGKRTNYMTHSEDALGNYRGCHAIWYK